MIPPAPHKSAWVRGSGVLTGWLSGPGLRAAGQHSSVASPGERRRTVSPASTVSCHHSIIWRLRAYEGEQFRHGKVGSPQRSRAQVMIPLHNLLFLSRMSAWLRIARREREQTHARAGHTLVRMRVFALSAFTRTRADACEQRLASRTRKRADLRVVLSWQGWRGPAGAR